MSEIDKFIEKYSTNTQIEIAVPELDTKFYATPLNLSEQSKIAKIAERDPAEGMAQLLIMKLTTSDGKPAFDKADIIKLTQNVSANIIANIASQITDASMKSNLIAKN